MKRKIVAIGILCMISAIGCGNQQDEKQMDDQVIDQVGNQTDNQIEQETASLVEESDMPIESVEENTEADMVEKTAYFSGEFTATVETMIPDYCALPGNTIAVVHYFQDTPFLLYVGEEMADQLIAGENYVFTFEPFEVPVAASLEYDDIKNHMHQIHVTDYRVANEDEIGLGSLAATVEIK